MRGASQGLGIVAMLADLGVKMRVRLKVDASAAMGIAMRRGLGKVRHIELNQLWLQDQVARGKIAIDKVDGKVNFADSLTKHSASDRVQQTISCTGQVQLYGRHQIMPTLT